LYWAFAAEVINKAIVIKKVPTKNVPFFSAFFIVGAA
jgi:hypothetical protein